MRKIDLIKQTITDALGYEVAKVTIEGSVADVTTTESERFNVMLYERKAEQVDEPCFSLSIVAVDAPDYESKDEFGDVVHTYANPLQYE